MSNKIIIISIVMFLLGGATFALYLLSSGSDFLVKTSTLPGDKVANRSENIDRHFIEQMIPHHEDAIAMAKLVLTNSRRSEIKEIAMNVIDSQSHENSQMKVWYKTWFGNDAPKVISGTHSMGTGRMHMGMMGNETDLEALENAEDFDKEFIEQMIPHHQMAVMMANMLLRATVREEMKTLAQNIIDAQTKEINDMRSWYSVWYQ